MLNLIRDRRIRETDMDNPTVLRPRTVPQREPYSSNPSSTHHRQSHELRNRRGCMVGEWLLLRCTCGNSFGSKSGVSASCTRCGSPSARRIRAYAEASELAEAVSSANLPDEIANQLSRRARSTNDKTNQTKRGSHGSAFELLNAMKSATASDGTLTIASLDSTLLRMEISEPTTEHLIGQAEMEGVLLRSDADTWSWLQQSS